MTLLELSGMIQTEFPTATIQEICLVTSELECRITEEMLLPAGITGRTAPLDAVADQTKPLLLSEENSCLYTTYLSAFFAMKDCDWDRANAFSELFNQKYAQLAVTMRRRHTPNHQAKLTGGGLV